MEESLKGTAWKVLLHWKMEIEVSFRCLIAF